MVESWTDLEDLLVRKIDAFRVDLEDGETAQSIGPDKQWMSRGRVAAFEDVRHVIAPLVEQEHAERAVARHMDAIESAWKDAGYHSSLEVWQAEQR